MSEDKERSRTMGNIVNELQRAAYVMLKDGWQSPDLAARAGLEILALRAQVKMLQSAPLKQREVGDD